MSKFIIHSIFFWNIYSNISSKNCHGNQFYFFTFFENSEEPDWICQLMLLVALREEWRGRIIKLEKVYKSILRISIYLSSYHANFVFLLQDSGRKGYFWLLLSQCWTTLIAMFGDGRIVQNCPMFWPMSVKNSTKGCNARWWTSTRSRWTTWSSPTRHQVW